jgi:hypothetical protein
MAFERKTDNGEVVKLENKGDSVTGYYLGSVDHQGDYGPTKKHLLKTTNGVKVIFGQKQLTGLLEDVEPGYLVRITRDGSKPGKKGNPMKTYFLDIDREQRMSQEEMITDESLDDTPQDEVQTAPAKPAPRATAPTNQTRSQVQNLLNNKR